MPPAATACQLCAGVPGTHVGGETRQRFAWAWIEHFDKRGEKKAPKLTRAELNGIIAAMKFCLECFVHV